MNYTIIKKLPPIEHIIQSYPLSVPSHQQIMQDRLQIKNILVGKDKRLLIIVGPCSAWPKEAVLEYAKRLVNLDAKVKNTLKLVMRVYVQKPRTTSGWTGPINQPNPLIPSDIEAGLYYIREMMVKIVDMGLPIAGEASFTHNAKVFLELLSWVGIGARSAENQEHRIFASSFDYAVGFKNPTHGSLAIAVNSVVAAQQPHIAAFDDHEVQTYGNPYAHLVLRGGNNLPNYSIAHIEEVKQYMDSHKVKNQAVIIDVSHDNCLVDGKKDYTKQQTTVFKVIESLQTLPALKNLVKGFMIESFIKAGSQKINDKDTKAIDLNGLSITDPCLSWEQTEELLLNLAALNNTML